MDKKTEEQSIDIEKLKKDLEDSKSRCEEYLNGWKRERADFLNYKKDEMERIGQLVKYANAELILKILPILDNIYLAGSHIPKEYKRESPTSPENSSEQISPEWEIWIKGFNQIKIQLEEFLKKEGIESIDVIGKPFDPNTMESVGEIVGDPTSHKSGTVAEETQRGYIMHGQIIRVAKVKISK